MYEREVIYPAPDMLLSVPETTPDSNGISVVLISSEGSHIIVAGDFLRRDLVL